MTGPPVQFLIFLIVVAAIFRDAFVFTLLYLLAGAFFFGTWWSRRALAGISFKRVFEDRAFPGNLIPVRLTVTNGGWLPLPWLRVHDRAPAEIRRVEEFETVTSLPSRGNATFDYRLSARARGLYAVGPLAIGSGDLLGVSDARERGGRADRLIVYPRVVPLSRIGLPSRSPMGALRARQPIFEDPTRPFAKREYSAGDPLRRIDWKATAAAGHLTVKQYEPAIDLEVALFLDLTLRGGRIRARELAAELAIVTAASVADYTTRHKLAIGLWTNGADPLAEDEQARPVPFHKGRAHFTRLLEVLARVEVAEARDFTAFLGRHALALPWGTTAIVIATAADEALLAEMLRMRRAGLVPVLLLCGALEGFEDVARRAAAFGIPTHHFEGEGDLRLWGARR